MIPLLQKTHYLWYNCNLTMKQTIHPKWFEEAKVSCACGNTFTVGSTKPEIHTEICNKCHPFFTGEMRFVDTLGRVEKFQAKIQFASTQAQTLAEKKKKKADKQAALKNQKSLKEMLSGLR
jgi:large subunit ribosomal protein L31